MADPATTATFVQGLKYLWSLQSFLPSGGGVYGRHGLVQRAIAEAERRRGAGPPPQWQTPGINPAAPGPTTRTGGELLGELLGRRTFVPKGRPVETEFERLLKGRTFVPRGGTVADRAPLRLPTRSGAGYYQAEAYFSLGQWAQRELRRLLDRRRLRRQRKGPSARPRSGRVPPQTPGQLDSAPKIPVAPKRDRAATTAERPALPRPAPVVVPRAPAAANRRPPQLELPQVSVQPGPVQSPRPARVPARARIAPSMPKTLSYASPILPLLSSKLPSARTRATRRVPSVAEIPQIEALTATQGAGGNSRCECKPGRSKPRRKPCRNPVVRKRTFVKSGATYQTVTRKMQCPA